jgi:hypothetical protein
MKRFPTPGLGFYVGHENENKKQMRVLRISSSLNFSKQYVIV